MKSLVKAKREPGIWMQEVPTPTYGVNDVLIKIEKTAICGTDIHIYQWDEWAQATIPTPMTVGHEFYGVVAEVGSEVEGVSVGNHLLESDVSLRVLNLTHFEAWQSFCTMSQTFFDRIFL